MNGRWVGFIAVFGLVSGLLLGAPPLSGAVVWGLLFVVGIALNWQATIRLLRRSGQALRQAAWRWWQRPLVAPLWAVRPRQWALEWLILAIIAGAVVLPRSELAEPKLRISGVELEWLTGHGEVAYQALRQYGDIPLWNPFYRNGEPLIDNAFSYLLNPFTGLPALAWGANTGSKVSVGLHGIMAAWGGWFLAWALRWSAPTRLLMGLLVFGKANMTAMLVMGYFQLGLQQAYFGWIIGGTVLVLRTESRWSVALTGLAMALLFLTGNVWYSLPMLLCCGALLLGLSSGRGQAAGGRRLALAAAITLGASATMLLPVYVQYDHIGNHPDEIAAGAVILSPNPFTLFTDGNVKNADQNMLLFVPRLQQFGRGDLHFYYSFVVPLWAVGWLIVTLPLQARIGEARVWWVAVVLCLLMTLWGMGGSDLWRWLYATVPRLAGWRFVGRALAVASFWVIVLVLHRFEALWRGLAALTPRGLRWCSAALVCLGGAQAAHQVIFTNWQVRPLLQPYDEIAQGCLVGLRQQYPNAPLAVWFPEYQVMTTFIQSGIRHNDIEAEFLPLPDPNTLGGAIPPLWQRLPEYGYGGNADARAMLLHEGYTPYMGVVTARGEPCFYRQAARALPYAFAVPRAVVTAELTYAELPAAATPLLYERRFDTVAVIVRGTAAEQVVLIDETAYPGWQVTVNGAPAPLEVVGGLNAVRLPPQSGARFELVFAYRPPLAYLGGALTIATCIFMTAYLLRVEKRVRLGRRNHTDS